MAPQRILANAVRYLRLLRKLLKTDSMAERLGGWKERKRAIYIVALRRNIQRPVGGRQPEWHHPLTSGKD